MLFIMPEAAPGSPAHERIYAFKKYYESRGQACTVLNSHGAKFWSILRMAIHEKTVFLSMPAFRMWWLFLIPGVRIILDIRDGWSIAMFSGYGGTTQRKRFKAFLARHVERFAIKRSLFTITCTPGLRNYLEKVSGRDVLLITNGVSLSIFDVLNNDFLGVDQIDSRLESDGTVILCCAGKFSEYGKDKAKTVIDHVAERYSNAGFVIEVYGADPEVNSWAVDYARKASNGRGRLKLIGRMTRDRLYEELSKCHIGIALIRDPDYDFGTKVFDYIALGLPVFNYFLEPNPFTEYFDRYLDSPFGENIREVEIYRDVLIRNALSKAGY